MLTQERWDRLTEDGVPTCAWPGGYQMIYVCADGEVICPACAGDPENDAGPHRDDDPSWRIIGAEPFYEGTAITCAHCNVAIYSAYGDPDCPVCKSAGIATPQGCPGCGSTKYASA